MYAVFGFDAEIGGELIAFAAVEPARLRDVIAEPLLGVALTGGTWPDVYDCGLSSPRRKRASLAKGL